MPDKKGLIFNIQKFSVNDGPGIRTVVFFKGCPLHCGWCSNPESQMAKVQVLWDAKKCIGCGHCTEVCPKGAISQKETSIVVNHSACSGCLNCVRECPKRALSSEGERKSVDEIMDVVMQDLPFYEESGGGLTLSGGEFLMQPEFAKALLAAAKERGLHTCCETTGYAREDIFRDVIAQVDYVFMDVKHWDNEKHKEGTGVGNEQILANLKYAIEAGKEVLPRIPIIPGFNDTLEDASALAEVLRDAGAKKVQLLPFHQFGENKYHMLHKKYTYEDVTALHREDLTEYQNQFLECGVEAFF